MKNKKFLKIGIPLLVIAGVAAGLWFGLKPSAAASTTIPQGQIVTIQKGDLKIDVTASGNLAFSQTADCAFDLAGYVDKVFVEAGDAVKKDQLLAQLDPTDWEQQKATQQRTIIQNQISVKNAQLSLENALGQNSNAVTGTAVAPDPLDIEIKQLNLQLAKANLENAQSQLAKIVASSPEVKAPFDGFVTKVNVKGGDEVFKGTIAVSMADPNKFEAAVLVNEIDIPRIQVGTVATLTVTSLANVILPAKVVSISPTATISGGVVNYSVKVQVDSTAPQATGTPTGSTGRNVALQTPGAGASMPALKDGLSINVSLVIQNKQGVVLVPSRAIVRSGRDSTVQVVKDDKDDAVESRVVKLGESNLQFTEVTDGLSAGEQVLIPSTTTSTSTSQQRTTTTGGIPGMGRVIR